MPAICDLQAMESRTWRSGERSAGRPGNLHAVQYAAAIIQLGSHERVAALGWSLSAQVQRARGVPVSKATSEPVISGPSHSQP